MEMLFRCVVISVSIFSCGCCPVTHGERSHFRQGKQIVAPPEALVEIATMGGGEENQRKLTRVFQAHGIEYSQEGSAALIICVYESKREIALEVIRTAELEALRIGDLSDQREAPGDVIEDRISNDLQESLEGFYHAPIGVE